MRTTACFLPAALSFVIAAGCASAPNEPFEPRGPVAQKVASAAQKNGVPVELLVALVHVEGGLRLTPTRDIENRISNVGVLALRHSADSLFTGGVTRGRRADRSHDADTTPGFDAGARVLDDIARRRGIRRESIEEWASVVEEMSGYRFERDRVNYRALVFKLLRRGGDLSARDGEVIVLPPNEDIPIELTISPPTQWDPGGWEQTAGALGGAGQIRP